MKKNGGLKILLVFFFAMMAGHSMAQNFYKVGYIRQSFFETNQVDPESMRANTDLMLMGFSPYSDGKLWQEFPHNDADLSTGVSRVASLAGRSGVLSFSGASGASMNGGEHLLILPTGGPRQFTFASWVYVNTQSSFVPGKFIFKKAQGNNEISLRVGANYGQLIFRAVVNGTAYITSANAATTGINANGWYHIALSFNGPAAAGNQVKLYINGEEKSMPHTAGTSFPNPLPSIRTPILLGENFEGSLDETLINTLALGAGDINNIYKGQYNFSSWNMTKSVAFWNYDDAAQPGKDSRSYKNILKSIRQIIGTHPIRVTACISSGDWQTALSTATGRTTLANDIQQLIVDNNLDGVDIDLEWPTNTVSGFGNYNAGVLAIRSAMGQQKILSLSLHPVSYMISKPAMDAADYIAMQLYGPTTNFWDLATFKTWTTTFLNYGFPKEKLVMGLPYFATTGASGGQTSYKNIVGANPGLSFDADQAAYSGAQYNFNGVTTILAKAAFVRDQNLAGIMSWDLATDMPYESPYSLMKATVQGLASPEAVRFGSWSGYLEKNNIVLNWSTLLEKNADKFIIEATTDSLTRFVAIDSVITLAIDHQSNTRLNYSLTKKLSEVTKYMGFPVYVALMWMLILGGCMLVSKKRRRNASLLIGVGFMLLMGTSCKKNTSIPHLSQPNIFVKIVYLTTTGQRTETPILVINKK